MQDSKLGGISRMLALARSKTPAWWLLDEKQLLTLGGTLLGQIKATIGNIQLVLLTCNYGMNRVVSCIVNTLGEPQAGTMPALQETAAAAVTQATQRWAAAHTGIGNPKGSAEYEAANIIDEAIAICFRELGQ